MNVFPKAQYSLRAGSFFYGGMGGRGGGGGKENIKREKKGGGELFSLSCPKNEPARRLSPTR